MSLCEFHGDCFGPRYFSEELRKYLDPKQSPPISHYDLKKDGAQLLLSKYEFKDMPRVKIITISLCVSVYFATDQGPKIRGGGRFGLQNHYLRTPELLSHLRLTFFAAVTKIEADINVKKYPI